MCKGVTGDAVLQRVLHSDEDIGVYSFQRVIALTTIAIRHDLAGDLADRILLVEPEVIDQRRHRGRRHRRPDRRAARRARRRPGPGRRRAARAARHRRGQRAADGRLRQGPRRPGHRDRLGHPGQLPGQGRRLALSLIEGNTFAYALYRLATCPSPGGLDPARGKAPPADLLDTLRRICQDARLAASDLPEDVRAVGRQVREIAPALRKAGIDIRPRKSGPRRLLRITQDRKRGPRPPKPGDLLFSGIRKDMSHMSHGRITAGQRPCVVVTLTMSPVMSHMSHLQGPVHVPDVPCGTQRLSHHLTRSTA